jgi:hypothetical protein
MTKLLVAAAVAFGAAYVPSRAFAAGEPERLSDAQLDEVTGSGMPFQFAGHHGHHHGMANQASGPTIIGTQVIFVIKDVTLDFNVGNNSSVNLAVLLQLAIASQQPQVGSVTAAQQSGHGHH